MVTLPLKAYDVRRFTSSPSSCTASSRTSMLAMPLALVVPLATLPLKREVTVTSAPETGG